MSEAALTIVLEFARTESPDDPYACQFGLQEYSLHTVRDGIERVETTSQVKLDWSDEFLECLQDLGEPRVDPGSIQIIGRSLRAFLEPANWGRTSLAIVEAIRQARPVYLSIRSRAAELYSLPWELLTLEGTGQCVGEIPGLLVRYEWPETTTTPPSAHHNGRLLVAWSAAEHYVPHAEQIDTIASAAQAALFDFDQQRDVVANATLGRLADALDEGVRTNRPVVALHILCHGGAAGDVHGLVLDGETPDAKVVVDAWRLRQLLAPYGNTVRLVVLSACDSANANGLFDSAALALHRAGIQTVLASRFLLSTRGSVSLTRNLYHQLLAASHSLEEAFLYARRALARDADKLDWASLQLYARQSDGHRTFPFQSQELDEDPVEERKTTEVPQQRSQQEILDLIDYDQLEMADLVVLRNSARRELQSRFAGTMAIMVIDLSLSAVQLVRTLPGSSGSLIERFRELAETAILDKEGRVYATNDVQIATAFPRVRDAIDAAFAVAELIVSHNYRVKRDELIVPRFGLHYGPILTDGRKVVGEACMAAARIAEAAESSILWLSQQALVHTSTLVRANCTPLVDQDVISTGKRLELYAMPLREGAAAPHWVVIENTGERMPLPQQDIISFGRLDKLPDGAPANDICLTLPDRDAQLTISRWHFELRRNPNGGHVIRVLSGQKTEVDHKTVARNAEAPVRVGTTICLVRKVDLRLEGAASKSSTRVDETRYE